MIVHHALPEPEFVDDARFRAALARAASTYGRTQLGFGLLRVAMRDVGDDALREGIREVCREAIAVYEHEDRTFSILLGPAGADDLTRVAQALARATVRQARASGLWDVQVLTAGALGSRDVPLEQFLEAAEAALRAVRCLVQAVRSRPIARA